jgi:hypothetical protein
MVCPPAEVLANATLPGAIRLKRAKPEKNKTCAVEDNAAS